MSKPLLHAKLTDHFLNAARWLTVDERSALLESLIDGSLFDAVESHDKNVAVCVGQSYVVGRRDRLDPYMVALLTVLPPDKANCLGRRSDTVVVPLRKSTDRITAAMASRPSN